MDFKVGDRVRIKIGAVDMHSMHVEEMRQFEGRLATVIRISADTRNCKVSVNGYGECWWWNSCALEPAFSSAPVAKPTWRIIIEGDENISCAKYIAGKKVIKEVYAKRYYKDKHDPAMAARALMEKMFSEAKEPEKPKYFTGRVVCVECHERLALTVGKIYEVKNGEIDCDEKHMGIFKVTSVENLNSRCKNVVKFIEIKE